MVRLARIDFPEPSLGLSEDGRIVGWNRWSSELFEWSPREVLGLKLDLLIRWGVRTVLEMGELSEGERVRLLRTGYRRNGETFHADLRACLAPPDQPFRYLMTVRDVTKLRLQEAARAALLYDPDPQTAQEALDEVFGRVATMTTLTLCRVDGKRRKIVAQVGAGAGSDDRWFSTEGTPLEKVGVRGIPMIFKHRRDRSDPTGGGGKGYQLVIPFLRDARVFAVLVVQYAGPASLRYEVTRLITDICAGVSLEIYNLLLTEEGRANTQKLTSATDLKDEYLALVSHDMRTPIAVISGFADDLSERWAELPDNEKLESLDAIRRNGRNLARLVDQGLEVSLMEARALRYRPGPFDLGELVVSTALDCDVGTGPYPRFRVQGTSGLPLASGDRELTWQILVNLFSNAMKFSPPDKPIDVTMQEVDGALVVSVEDRGPGISEEDVDKLFVKFGRLGQGTRKEVRGAGLGLYICRGLVEAQGGRIWVERRPGGGTVFAFSLQISESQVLKPEARPLDEVLSNDLTLQ